MAAPLSPSPSDRRLVPPARPTYATIATHDATLRSTSCLVSTPVRYDFAAHNPYIPSVLLCLPVLSALCCK
ncbi:hypothetical protein BJV74DRAFT_846794 [Russula compacta]|nr:hypothetical protein BJV74DRAFT_846794 [Russula compacta]